MFDNRLQSSNEPLISSSYTTTEQAQPLFTLTAEEVEIFQQLLTSTKKEFYKLKPTFEVAEKIIQIDNLLTRINKWQQRSIK